MSVTGMIKIVTLIYFPQVILIRCFFSKNIQRSVANVPIGVNNAPMSLPITLAKYATCINNGFNSISVIESVPIITAGKLLKILERAVVNNPIIIVALNVPCSINSLKFKIINVFNPTFFNPYTSTYMLKAKINICHGELIITSFIPTLIFNQRIVINMNAPNNPINSNGIPNGERTKNAPLVMTTTAMHILNKFLSIFRLS